MQRISELIRAKNWTLYLLDPETQELRFELQEISQSPFLQSEGFEIKITASCGIASYPQDARDMGELLRVADASLYVSKDRGKNSVTAV